MAAHDVIVINPGMARECLNRYNNAEDTLNEAMTTLERAIEELKADFTGRALVAMAAAVAILVAKIRKSIERVDDAKEELNYVMDKAAQTESELNKTFSGLDIGEASQFIG